MAADSIPSLSRTAGLARISLTVGVERFLNDLDPQSRAVARGAFALGHHRSAPWPVLMRGALQVRRQSGPVGETLWFNPVFDAGLLLRWRYDPAGWRVTDAWWVLGADIRHDEPETGRGLVLPIGEIDPAPANGRAPMAVDDAAPHYAFDHSVFALVADADWAPPAASDERRIEAARRVWGAVTAMQAFDVATGTGAGRTRALNYLMDAAVDPAATMTPATLRVLRGLDRSIRASMYPVSAFHRADGRWRLVMQSIDAPAVAIAVTLDAASVKVSEVEAFDYGAPATAEAVR